MNTLTKLPETGRGGTFQSTQSSPYLEGYEATLSCGEGYKPPHIITSKVVNGLWDPPKLDCLPLSVLTELPWVGPGTKVKSQSQPPYHLHDQATIKCDFGYLKPFHTISHVVIENGLLKWNPSSFKCKVIQCDAPPYIPNGNILESYRSNGIDQEILHKNFLKTYPFSHIIRFVCDTGYQLTGHSINKSFVCTTRGLWSEDIQAQSYQCVLDQHWCPKLESPANGTVFFSNGFSIDSIATFSCNKGFYLTKGLTERICQTDKTWSGQDISCIKPVCPQMESDVKFRFIEGLNKNIVECPNKDIYVKCLPSGQWQYKYPYCTKEPVEIKEPLNPAISTDTLPNIPNDLLSVISNNPGKKPNRSLPSPSPAHPNPPNITEPKLSFGILILISFIIICMIFIYLSLS